MGLAITPKAGGTPIILDASVQETQIGEVDVTEHPVETGANVADHVRPRPKELRIDGVIADFPLPGTPSALLVGTGEDGRAEAVFAQLEEYRDAGTVLRIDTAARSYDNMVITSLPRSRSKDAADTVRFTATLKEIRFVDTQLVPIAKSSINAGRGKVDGGKKAARRVGREDQRASLLYKAYKGTDNFIAGLQNKIGNGESWGSAIFGVH